MPTADVLHLVVKEGVQVPALIIPENDALDVVWETAPRSRADLDQLESELADVADETFVSADQDIATGRVILTVTKEADVDALKAKYGDFADIEIGTRLTSITCVDRAACTPWRGGLYIYTDVDSNHNISFCTYGYTTRGDTNGDMRMLTAGHCQ
jgi:hypothetical protein